MLTVLRGLAEFERELIRARTSEGQARAKAKRLKLDRKPKKLTPHQKCEAVKRRDVDSEPVREIARSYNVHGSTISRRAEPGLACWRLFRSPNRPTSVMEFCNGDGSSSGDKGLRSGAQGQNMHVLDMWSAR
jgi:CENP-B N-terminal DNA-binding domain